MACLGGTGMLEEAPGEVPDLPLPAAQFAGNSWTKTVLVIL